jgi:tetratricopeptide (TPR) repeat protein
MRARIEFGRLASPLPYRVQNGYGRRLASQEMPALELDNGLVRAVVLPGLGGRVWSLVDRARDRELLFANPVLQYANFALTDAWVAGGIEWNLGSTGHATTTSRPVHAGVVRRDDGDVLRLWEWERTRDLVLQVDLSLPEGSDRLVASTRVVNPDPEDKPLYWWTTIAVPETTGTRVLTEADSAFRTDYSGTLSRVAVPHPDDDTVDISHPMVSGHAADYFYDVAGRTGRFLVSVEPDGRGFAQSSTDALTGRKLFLWGHGAGGSRWQEWLCGSDARYIEIQAGRCPTQLEHDVIPGRGQVCWTEAFGGVDLDPEAMAGPYADAAAHARAAVHEAVPPESLDDRHRRWLDEVADAPVDEVLAVGSGWGQVEILLRDGDSTVPDALPFPEVDDDSAPARALLEGDLDAFERTVERLPVPPVSDRWLDRLGSASEHWWADYARGVQHHVRGETDPARAAYDRSVASQPNAGALRGLAVLATADGDLDTALAHYSRARELLPDSRPLATELLQMLLDADRPEDALAVVDTLPEAVRRHGRTRLQEAQAHAATGATERADALLSDLVVEDLAEGETVIGDLWSRLHPNTEIPPHLDFRMHQG